MKFLFLTAMVLLVACAKGGSDSSGSVSSKSLASVWSSPGAPNWTIDLSQQVVGRTFNMTVSYLSGGSCQAMAYLKIENDQNGDPVPTSTLVIFNSETLVSAPGMAACTMFDGTWSYNLYGNSFILCQGTTCTELN